MKKTLLLTITTLSLLTLVACGSKGGSTSTAQSSSNSTAESSASISSVNIKSTFAKALEKDYSNMVVDITQSYYDGEMVELDYEYYYDGFICVYSAFMAEMGYDDPWLYYHDYQGDSYLYFEPDQNNPNPVGAWLNKGYYDADLSIENAYFSMSNLLSNLSVEDVVYTSGLYIVETAEATERLNRTAFGFAYENDLTAISFILDDDGYFSKIIAFDDPNNEDNYVVINFNNIGSCQLPESAVLPEAPNENNVMEYWQYKGYDGPLVDKYIDALSIAVDPSRKEGSYDAILDIEEGILATSSYTPVDANKHSLTWYSSDENVVKVDYASETGTRTLVGTGAGEATIYAVAEGSNVRSNELHIKVNPLKEQNKEGCVYDLLFTGLNDGIVGVQNALKNDKPVSVTGSKAHFLSGKNTEIWEETENVVYLNPMENLKNDDPNSAEPQMPCELSFDFDDQQVSSISFYYGECYANGVSEYSKVNSVKIQTSNDGVNWTEIDITDEVKANISAENLKLMEKDFAPASKVKISLKSNMIGGTYQPHFALSGAAFMADENCANHEAESEAVLVDSIAISPSATSVFPGKTISFQSVVTPSNATDASLVWESSDTSVATIVDGVLTGVSQGTTTVTAKNVASGVVSNSVVITVNAPLATPSGMLGVWNGSDSVANDMKFTFTDDGKLAAVVGDETFSLDLVDYSEDTRMYHFVDENENYVYAKLSVSYSNSLDVIAVLGSHTVGRKSDTSYMSESFSKFIVATAITATCDKTTLIEGETTTITTKVTPTNATNKTVSYVSSDEGVVTVSSTGKVTAVGAGSATVTVSNEDGVSDVVEFTVVGKTFATSITIEGKDSINIGEQTTLSVTYSPENINQKGVTWVSSDPEIATVSSDGKVLGMSAGTVTITATTANGVTATKTITVNATAALVPAAFVGTFTAEDGLGSNTFTLVISADGTAVLTCEDIEYEVVFTIDLTKSSSNDVYFVSEDGIEINCYNATSTGFVFTYNDGDPDYDFYFGFQSADFERA